MESAQVVAYDELLSEADVEYTGTCWGHIWSSDQSGSGTATWSEHEFGSLGSPAYAPGNTHYWPNLSDLTISWTESRTSYKYGAIKSSVVNRAVKVAKVANTRKVTITEFRRSRCRLGRPGALRVEQVAGRQNLRNVGQS